MTDVVFGRLEDLPLRDAWTHEARAFTPWLAENIEHLSEVIGIPLELTGTEVAVETFSADVLARNPQDGSVVLIENQLEITDHTHLGQIMTYLAGLQAQTVVWIAPQFRKPHLSAIRWLNEHTADGFSFFAVRLRVVRIGDSPFAPIFEVEEQPSDWERLLKKKAAPEGAAYYDIKEKFWTALLSRHPHLAEAGLQVWRYPNNFLTVCEDPRAELAVWIGKTESGVYVRSGRGDPIEPVVTRLETQREALEAALGVPFGPVGRGNHLLSDKRQKGHVHETDWAEIMDWMDATIARYRAVIEPILNAEP